MESISIMLVTAPWCNSCKPLKLHLDGKDTWGQFKFVMKDLETDLEELKHLNIRSVPTIVLLDNNEPFTSFGCGGVDIFRVWDNIEEQVENHINGK